MTFENIVAKGENAGNQHFHLFPQCFMPFKISWFFFLLFFGGIYVALNLDQSNILSFGRDTSNSVVLLQ